jgi:hypothetical protein
MADTLKIIGRRLSKKKVNFKSASPSASGSGDSGKSSSSSSGGGNAPADGFREDVMPPLQASGFSTRTKLLFLLLIVLITGFVTLKLTKTSFPAHSKKAAGAAAAVAGAAGGYYFFIKK